MLIAKFRISLGLLLLVGLCFAVATGVSAQEDDIPGADDPHFEFASKECNGVDLVVLVDQSESMELNDREDMSFETSKLIVDFLGNHANWLCFGQDVQHRLAIVGFGDQSVWRDEDSVPNNYNEDVREYLGPITVPEANDVEAWAIERRNLRGQLDGFEEDYLGATDHISAFHKARDILNDWEEDDAFRESSRRKSIIVLTDGGPCQRSDGCGYAAYSYGPAMENLANYADAENINVPWTGNNSESIFVSMVALAGSGENYQDIPAIQEGWDAIVENRGLVFSANDLNTDLATGVSDILSPIIGSGMEKVPCDTTLPVRPYVDDLVIFYLFAQGSTTGDLEDVETTIVIERDGEQFAAIRNGRSDTGIDFIQEYQQDGPNEFYILSPALPGNYRIQAENIADECQDLDARVQRNSIRAEVVLPTNSSVFAETINPPYYNEDHAEKLVVKFEMRGGEDQEGDWEPLTEFADYPLKVEAHLASENGDHSQTFPLVLADSEEPGVYESTEFIQTPIPGRYNWSVTATAPSPVPGETEVDVLSQSDIVLEGSFIVGDVTKFGFEIEEPEDEFKQALNTVSGERQIPTSIPVAVRLTDGKGGQLNVSEVLKNTGGILEATFSTTDGTVIETIPLNLEPGTADRFVGTLSNSKNGEIVDSGDYVISVASMWSAGKDYDTTEAVPVAEIDSVAMSQYEVFPLAIEISPPPEPVLLHARWLDSPTDLRKTLFSEPQPYSFAMHVINTKTGEKAELSSVLADISATYQAEVLGPNDTRQTVPLEAIDQPINPRFVGTAGTEVDETGDYHIRIETTDFPLQDRFWWSESDETATFTRSDIVETNPTVLRTIAAILAVIALLIMLWSIYRLTGGPRGQISIVGVGTFGGRETIAGPWSLRRSPRKNTVKNNALKEHGIKSLTVRKSRSLDPEIQDAVHVEAKTLDNQTLFSGTLDNGITEPFIESGEIIYEK